MLGVGATSAVVDLLSVLRDDEPESFMAIRDRIRLIRTDPGHPQSRGVTRKIPDGPLVRAVIVTAPARAWRLAWTLGEGDVVQLIALEPDDP